MNRIIVCVLVSLFLNTVSQAEMIKSRLLLLALSGDLPSGTYQVGPCYIPAEVAGGCKVIVSSAWDFTIEIFNQTSI